MDFVQPDLPLKTAATIAARQTAETAAASNEQNPNKISYELNISRGKGIVVAAFLNSFFHARQGRRE